MLAYGQVRLGYGQDTLDYGQDRLSYVQIRLCYVWLSQVRLYKLYILSPKGQAFHSRFFGISLQLLLHLFIINMKSYIYIVLNTSVKVSGGAHLYLPGKRLYISYPLIKGWNGYVKLWLGQVTVILWLVKLGQVWLYKIFTFYYPKVRVHSSDFFLDLGNEILKSYISKPN